MQTWVTLAAKHATLASGIGLGAVPALGWDSLDGVAVGFLLAGAGFAAVNSSRQVRSCPPAASAGPVMAESARTGGGALTRIRRRVDGLLTSMLSDDAEHLSAQPPVLVPVPSAAEAADPDIARPLWRGDYVDAIAGPAGLRWEGAVAAAGGAAASGRTARPAADPAPEHPGRPGRVGHWPYLTVVRDTDEEPDVARRVAGRDDQAGGDQAFWGPKLADPASGGRRSKHRTEGSLRPVALVSETKEPGKDRGTAGNGRAADGRRPAPRHAAPPAGFGATLGRRLTSPKLTSRSAAHAG